MWGDLHCSRTLISWSSLACSLSPPPFTTFTAASAFLTLALHTFKLMRSYRGKSMTVVSCGLLLAACVYVEAILTPAISPSTDTFLLRSQIMQSNGMKLEMQETKISPFYSHLTIDQLSKANAATRSVPKAGIDLIDRFLWCKRILRHIFQAIATRQWWIGPDSPKG